MQYDNIEVEVLRHPTEQDWERCKRLCGQADPTTRYVMYKVCREVSRVNPEFEAFLVPMCMYRHECPEFHSCGYWEANRNDVP